MPVKIGSTDAFPRPAARRKTLRLFCLPYAAGSARVFRGWHRHLPGFVDVRPLELPGHGRRNGEDPVGELAPVMTDLLGQVLREADLPCAILGYDYGALLGFELAYQLARQHGIEPRHLFVAAMRAPVWPRPVDPISEMSEERFRELLRQPGGGSSGDLLDTDSVMDFAIRVLRADFRVADNYRCVPGKRVSCPITAFRGRADAGVSSQAVRAWNVCTADEFRWHELPGGRYFLHPAKELFLHRLSAELRAHQRQPAVPVA